MTEERDLLRETVRGIVAKHGGSEAVREAMASERGYDESLWKLLCEQVGAAALIVPEELGGAGGELSDVATVLSELARGFVPSPLLGTTLAELALLASDEVDADTLARLAAGTAIGAVVLDSDARFGAAWHGGRVTIGVVVHSDSTVAAHGPGVTPLLTGPASCLRPIRDNNANIAYLYQRRAVLPPRARQPLAGRVVPAVPLARQRFSTFRDKMAFT